MEEKRKTGHDFPMQICQDPQDEQVTGSVDTLSHFSTRDKHINKKQQQQSGQQKQIAKYCNDNKNTQRIRNEEKEKQYDMEMMVIKPNTTTPK